MPNVAAVLKAETIRLAKKEAKSATSQLKKASAQSRRDIANLRRLVSQQAKEMAYLRKLVQKQRSEPTVTEPSEKVRFSPRSVKAQRRRLKLSALDYGRLVGVSGLTIYAWESGKSRPRKAPLAALVAVRGIGKREATKRLEEVKKPAAVKKGRG
jgi:DNA-binding transcriptional regulator YiaG